MTSTVDVVVAGGGHNGLVTAAYLARAGYEVLVLDARDVPGGGVASEELLLPGWWADSCSTGHTLIQTNPLLARDELGLLSEYGLTYIDPDPVAHVAFPDGEQMTMWLDVDRTEEELARFSSRDATTYRRMLADWASVAPLFGRARTTPVGSGPALTELLAGHPSGGTWQRRALLSAWEVIRHEFEDRHVQAFVAWQAFMTFVSIDLPGSGTLPYSIMSGRQRRSWTIPAGGSGRLSDALVAAIEAHRGTVLCGQHVSELVLHDGRCGGVVTREGRRFMARRAVVSSLHVEHLVEMAPREAWHEDFLYGVATFDRGLPLFAVHLALSAAPRFVPEARGGRATPIAVSSGLAGWPQDVVDVIRACRDGRTSTTFPWILLATPTLADRSRAPEGCHTAKLLVPASPTPPHGTASWDDAKEAHADALVAAASVAIAGLAGDAVVGRLAMSPLDIERANPAMVGGTAHGGDRGVPFSGAQRPAPGWADHRTPIPGLYQTGATTHPGGSVTGMPGRNAAQVLLGDLGTSLEAVVARPAGKCGQTV